jgi:myo-inositol 2-dehydrogenase/D-chiro-inositol 1-dehydrogenase
MTDKLTKRVFFKRSAAIMGRTAAYTGRLITWDEIFKSDMDLGPKKIEMGPVDMLFETPVPGTPIAI